MPKPRVEDILLDEDGIPYIVIRPNYIIFHDKASKGWRKIDKTILSLGLFKNELKTKLNNSSEGLLISNQNPRDKFDSFMKSLYNEDRKPLDDTTKFNHITKLEEALLYYIDLNDLKGYMKIVEKYLIKLIEYGEYNNLRIYLIEDLHKSSGHKDYEFLQKHKVNLTELYKHFKEIMKGQSSLLNQKVRDILREIDNVIQNINLT